MDKNKHSIVSAATNATVTSKHTNTSNKDLTKILPNDLVNYLPWACLQLQFSFLIYVNRISIASAMALQKSKSKSKAVMSPECEGSDEYNAIYEAVKTENRVIKLDAKFEGDHLIELIFVKNQYIPRELLALLGEIICFQTYLTTLTFNNHINVESIYEIRKFLPVSYITDLCLDGCYIEEGNYHILLDEETSLRHLSLSRCNINDEIVKNIASLLSCFKPASKKLALLNLSSNKITDIGAQCIAQALRMNRRLNYLNLANNLLTDNGVTYILDILQEFPLTYDEILEKKSRRFDYFRKKMILLAKVMNDLKVEETEKQTLKPKLQAQKKEKDIHEKSKRSPMNVTIEDKAEMMVLDALGEFSDPYSPQHIEVIDEYPYCKGNNNLCFLNLAYNNLSYFSVCKIVEVLDYQKIVNRIPRGLVNISIEGNNIPPYCRELNKIDALLSMLLFSKSRLGNRRKTLI